jgi:hypothetical protein
MGRNLIWKEGDRYVFHIGNPNPFTGSTYQTIDRMLNSGEVNMSPGDVVRLESVDGDGRYGMPMFAVVFEVVEEPRDLHGRESSVHTIVNRGRRRNYPDLENLRYEGPPTREPSLRSRMSAVNSTAAWLEEPVQVTIDGSQIATGGNRLRDFWENGNWAMEPRKPKKKKAQPEDIDEPNIDV